MLRPFSNEPLTDFTRPENRQAFQAALDKVKAEIGGAFPLVIGGETSRLDDTFPSINPSRPAEILGHFANGGVEHADAAIEAASYAFRTWRTTPVAERVRYLLGVAAEMRRRKHEFSAMMVLEVGKNWVEADIDTAEAIDFM
jgi:1-pyrroline-5-carboxylate dehydrogenase